MDSSSKNDMCGICGLDVKEHPKCEGCGILVGPGHYEKSLVPVVFDGKTHMVSSGCAKWGKRARNWNEFVHGSNPYISPEERSAALMRLLAKPR